MLTFSQAGIIIGLADMAERNFSMAHFSIKLHDLHLAASWQRIYNVERTFHAIMRDEKNGSFSVTCPVENEQAVRHFLAPLMA